MLDVRDSHLYFYQSLNRLQRGLSAIAELLVGVPAVDYEQSNTSLMNGRRRRQFADMSQCAGRVGRPGWRVGGRQAVERPVTELIGEVEHEARSIGERDQSEARARVQTDQQRLTVLQHTHHVCSADTCRRVDSQHQVNRLSARYTRTHRDE